MRFELVVLGASWGGLHAAGKVIAALPPDFGLPFVIAQHRVADPSGGHMLEDALQARSALPVVEVHDKEPLVPRNIYLAPAGYHTLVEPGELALSTDQRVRYSRPSIDVLFESAAQVYRERLIGVILTGVGEDGAAGLARIRHEGGYTIAQDPQTAERADMPRAAIAAGGALVVLRLEQIGPRLVQLARPRAPLAEGGRR